MSIKVAIVPVTPYQQNCSMVKCEATGRAPSSIRAAMSTASSAPWNRWRPGGENPADPWAYGSLRGQAELRKKLECPSRVPTRQDAFWIDKLPEWCQMSGLPHADAFEPDRWLEDGDTVTVGASRRLPSSTARDIRRDTWCSCTRVSAWPGSAMCCSRARSAARIFPGQPRGVGRRFAKLFPLGDHGHGPTSNFGHEPIPSWL